MNKKQQVEELKNKIIQETTKIFNQPANIKISYSVTRKPKNIILTWRKNEESLIVFNVKSDSHWFDRTLLKRLTSPLKNESFPAIDLLYDFKNLVGLLVDDCQLTVKELREEKGLTQQQLADELGANLRTIQNWEKTGVNSAMNRKLLSLYFRLSEKKIDFKPKNETPLQNTILLGNSGTGKTMYIYQHLDEWANAFPNVYLIFNKGYVHYKQFIKSKSKNIKPLPFYNDNGKIYLEEIKKVLQSSTNNLIIVDELDTIEMSLESRLELDSNDKLKKEFDELLKLAYQKNKFIGVVHPSGFYDDNKKRFEDLRIIEFDEK